MSEGIRYKIEEIESEQINPQQQAVANQGVPQFIIDYIAKAKPHLVILTPCYNSSMYVTYTESLLQTMFMCKDMGINATIHFCRNDSLVSRARNNLIAKAMSISTATHFLFIDADITWSPYDILKLLVADKPIVGGIYPIKNYEFDKLVANPNALNDIFIRKNKSQLKDSFSNKEYLQTNMVRYNINYASNMLEIENNLTKVKHLATGFMLIKRTVIEVMSKAFPQTKYVDDVNFLSGKENDFAYALFDCGVEDGHYLSEDWMFCNRWQKMGGSVYADITINLDHTGIETYKGSFISSIM
jgi:hypothetical protein